MHLRLTHFGLVQRDEHKLVVCVCAPCDPVCGTLGEVLR